MFRLRYSFGIRSSRGSKHSRCALSTHALLGPWIAQYSDHAMCRSLANWDQLTVKAKVSASQFLRSLVRAEISSCEEKRPEREADLTSVWFIC